MPEGSHLTLRFTQGDNGARLSVPLQDPPWRAIRAFHNSRQQAVVYLHNVSGGIVSGDSLHLSIEAGTSTRAQVTSVGATRVYRQRIGKPPARLRTAIQVEDGAMLEYLPDVIIPFAGSRLTQSTTVTLGANAGYIGWETLAAGRIASGEEFKFDFFHSEFSLYSGARPLALERYSLAPAERDMRSAARWGRFRYSTTLYICHTGVDQARWNLLEARLNDFAFEQTGAAARWGVSTLVAGGIVVRGLALQAHQVTTCLSKFWSMAKQEIWGESAIAPRKIN